MTDQTERLKLMQFANDCLLLRKSLVLGTTTLTPLNFEEEKEKFFASQTYNPIFYYRQFNFSEIDKELKTLNQKLQNLSLPKDIKTYLKSYLKNLKLLERTISSIGTDEFWYHAKRLFEFDLIHADQVLSSLPDISFQNETHEKLFSAPEIANEFRSVLYDMYGLSDVEVFIDHFSSHIIRAGRKRITIGSSVKRFDSNVKRLIVHEIESHVLQNYNTTLLNNPLLKLASYNESLLYGEGIAVFNEIYSGTITKKAYQEYLLRLKAVSMLDKSFREIHEYLSNYVTPQRAFLITYRVKRGMKDTASYGGFPKDASYLLGYKKVRDYVKNGSNLEFLYICRIPALSSLFLRHNLVAKGDILLPKFIHRQDYSKEILPAYTEENILSHN